MQDFDEALARHKLLVKRACNARDRARAQRHWLTWLRGVLAVSRLRRLAPVPPAAVGGAAGTAAGGAPVAASDAEEILRAGITGEQQVVADLGQVLGDDWVMVRGYCNRRGEIDHLLLGPPGLIAIESKHLNATVTCDGDDWRFEKFDRYGNLVERGRLGDKRGRSPSVQLNEPADMLAEFLSTRGSKVSILRVVLLTHPNSKLGKCRNATVHIGTSSRTLARQLAGLPPVVGAAQRARLEELIARDHRYHEERRQRPPAARPPAARPLATPGAQPPAGRRATSRRAATARPPGRERA
jgi:hypothetical protein